MGQFVADQGIMMLVTVAVIAICAVLALYVLYSVTWRAVRRGLREFNASLAPAPAPNPLAQTPVRSMRLHMPHRVAVKVPDYPPRDWVA